MNSIFRSDFFKSSFYTAISVIIRMITLLLLSKVIAVYLGKEGLGLIGQLTNFVTIVLVVAGGCINVGIVKYVADYNKNDKQALTSFLHTSFLTILILALACSAVLILFSGFFAEKILLSERYSFVFILFGSTLVFYSLNTFVLSILNGYKQYQHFNIVNIVTSVSGLCISFILIHEYHLSGAFYAIVVNQSVVFFITLAFTLKHDSLKVLLRIPYHFKFSYIKMLSGFIIMALVSTLFVPGVQLYLRSYIIHHLGLPSSGIWEAVCRISNVHILFVTTTLSTYYLPRLSEIKLDSMLQSEIIKMLKIIVPLVLISSFIVFLLRYYIINILYTDDFQGAGDLLGWQLAGDVFKIISWIIGYQMHAKALTKTFIITEIIGGLTCYFLSVLLISYLGLIGAPMAYALNYFIYLVMLCIIFRRILFTKFAKV